MKPRAFIVTGLGYGDEGKGGVVDWLVRHVKAPLVVRHNGGAQAAHNVVTFDGRHHTFSQWGSGTFAGADTYLSRHVVVDPFAMRAEAEHLELSGIDKPYAKLFVDARAPVVTPYHKAVNRLRELARGKGRHGSCGRGIGIVHETMTDPRLVVRIEDVAKDSRARLTAKLLALRSWAQSVVPQITELTKESELANQLLALSGEDVASALIANVSLLQVVEEPRMISRIREEVTVFEGAQGVLLDEQWGFYPHVTRGTTVDWNAIDLVGPSRVLEDQAPRPVRIGVLRSYVTRHGVGPLVTEAPELRLGIREGHNRNDPWQGPMRFGWFDGPLARYAVEINTGVDMIALTHMDALERFDPWRMCVRYTNVHEPDARIARIASASGDMTARATLTDSMFRAQPAYINIDRQVSSYVEAVSTLAGVPVGLHSYGPTERDKRINFIGDAIFHGEPIK